MPHLSSHSANLTRSSCNASWSARSLIVRLTTQSSANSLVLDPMLSGRSLMNKRNSNGQSTEPWGIPLITGTHSDSEPSTTTFWDLWLPVRKDVIQVSGVLWCRNGWVSAEVVCVELGQTYQRSRESPYRFCHLCQLKMISRWSGSSAMFHNFSWPWNHAGIQREFNDGPHVSLCYWW